MAYNKEFDTYIKKAPEFSQPILKHLRELVHKVCPDAEEVIKWGALFFDYKGVMINMASFKEHVGFGFWKQTLMKDPDKLFVADTAGSFGKIKKLSDLPSDKILTTYIKQAMQINDEGKKVAPPRNAKTELKTPAYLTKALAANKVAKAGFEKMAPGHRREYIVWLEDAKTEETREKRLAIAISQIAEGKSRHWKYQK